MGLQPPLNGAFQGLRVSGADKPIGLCRRGGGELLAFLQQTPCLAGDGDAGFD
jgi:hypothetical protein